jgi:hypothetical protein
VAPSQHDGGMRKPSVLEIRSARKLTDEARSEGRDVFSCVGCGAATGLTAWRECDEHDREVEGAVVFLCPGAACRRRLNEHPRLYKQVTGGPGHFPGLCGGCGWRDGMLGCLHPDLKANGGGGLRVEMSDPWRGAICVRTSRGQAPRVLEAVRCEGREERS